MAKTRSRTKLGRFTRSIVKQGAKKANPAASAALKGFWKDLTDGLPIMDLGVGVGSYAATRCVTRIVQLKVQQFAAVRPWLRHTPPLVALLELLLTIYVTGKWKRAQPYRFAAGLGATLNLLQTTVETWMPRAGVLVGLYAPPPQPQLPTRSPPTRQASGDDEDYYDDTGSDVSTLQGTGDAPDGTGVAEDVADLSGDEDADLRTGVFSSSKTGWPAVN